MIGIDLLLLYLSNIHLKYHSTMRNFTVELEAICK